MVSRLSETRSDRWHLFMGAVVLLALGLRVYWIAFHTAVIENDGGNYARVAENLIKGNGYIGIVGTPAAWMPPVFPLLIALFSVATGSVELAGRLVSAVFGALLPLPLGAIAREIHGARSAVAVALLAAFHPLLVTLSGAVYSESTYLTLFSFGLWMTLRSRKLEHRWAPLLSGIVLSLAYLTRPEALILPGLGAVFVVLSNWRNSARRRRDAVAALTMLGAFVVVSTPYVVAVSSRAGCFTLAPKGINNYLLGLRMLEGKSLVQAAWEVDENLTEQGAYFRFYRDPWGTICAHDTSSASTRLRYFVAMGKQNLPEALRAMTAGPFFGSPPLFWLVVLGLFGSPWSLHRLRDETFLVLALACTLLPLAVNSFVITRFFFSELPILLLWAAKGIERAGAWVVGTATLSGGPRGQWRRGVWLVETVIGLSLVVQATRGVSVNPELQQGWRANTVEKDAGLWLGRFAPGPKTVMTSGNAVAFYSGGIWNPYPASDGAVALRYIEQRKPDFLVLRRATASSRAYLADRAYLAEWIEKGIPDGRAERIYRVEGANGDEVLIYRWRQ